MTTVYEVLKHVDKVPSLCQKIDKVFVYFYDCEKSKESIEFQKSIDIDSWFKNVEKAISGNRFLQSLFQIGPVIDTNLGSVRLNLISHLEITVTVPFIAEDLKRQKEWENTKMDNQQLSKGKKETITTDAILQCDTALEVDQLKQFLNIIDDGLKVFMTDGKKIYPLSMMSIVKIAQDDNGDDEMCIVLGSMNKDLTFKSSTTSE